MSILVVDIKFVKVLAYELCGTACIWHRLELVLAEELAPKIWNVKHLFVYLFRNLSKPGISWQQLQV